MLLKKTKYVLLGILVFCASYGLSAQAAGHALGSNIITPEGTVFKITTENGQTVRRPYTSSSAFLSYSFNTWDTIMGASAEDINLPVGSFIPPQDGKVICSDRGGDKGTCYLITAGQKAGFTSSDVFKKLGYSFDNATMGDVSFLPVTTNIDSGILPHNPGSLINKDGTVYVVSPKGLLGVPDLSTLMSWGYSFADIVSANSADRNLSYAGTLPSRHPEELAPLNNIPTIGTPPILPTPSPIAPVSTSTSNIPLYVSVDPTNPVSSHIGAGVTQAEVFAFKLSNTSSQTIPIYSLSVYLNGNIQTSDISKVYWYSNSIPDVSNPLWYTSSKALGYGPSGYVESVIQPTNDTGHPGLLVLSPTNYPIPLFSISGNGTQTITVKVNISNTAINGRTFTASLISNDYINKQNSQINIIGIPIAGNPMTIVSLNTSPTTTPSSPRVGQLIKSPDSTVYLVGNNGLIGIPSVSVFNTWCFLFSEVVPANDAEKLLSQTSMLESRQSGQLLPNNVSVLKVTTCPPASTSISTSPVLTITSPTSSSSWQSGQSNNISWSTTNATSDMWVGIVEVYKDSDPLIHADVVTRFSHNSVASSTPWVVPSNFGSGSDYHVRVVLYKGDSTISTVVSPAFSIASGVSGRPKLYISLNPPTQLAQIAYPGSANVEFTKLKFTCESTGSNCSLSALSVSADTPAAQTGLSNVRIYDGTTQLGAATTLSNDNNLYPGQKWNTISFPDLVIPKNSTKIITIRADISPNIPVGTAIRMGASGLIYGSTGPADGIFVADPLYGNAVYIASPFFMDTPQLDVSLDPSTPISKQIPLGSTNVEFTRLKFTCTATVKDCSLSSINVWAIVASTYGPSNIRIYDGSTQLGATTSLIFSDSTNPIMRWNIINLGNLIIPKNSSKVLSITADIGTNVVVGERINMGAKTLGFGSTGVSYVSYSPDPFEGGAAMVISPAVVVLTPPPAPVIPTLPTTQSGLVTHLYACILSRNNPDQPGFNLWLQNLQSKAVSIPNSFVYFYGYQDGLSDADFTNNIYACMLFRQPDSLGLPATLAALSSGTARTTLVQMVLNSAEFNTYILPKLNALK